MSKADVARNVFLDTLNSQLKEIEERIFKVSDWAGVAAARDKMISVMRSTVDRYERGVAVRDYRNQYRQHGGEQAWRDDDGAGAKIARIEGNGSAKSVDFWIDDAEFAEPLGDLLREAMLTRSYDPTVRKNRNIVRSLLEKRPEDIDAALKLVDDAFLAHSNGKGPHGPASTADLEEQLVVRISNFIIKHRNPPWKEALDEIYKQVAAVLKAERAERAAGIRKNGHTLIPQASPDAIRPSGPEEVLKPAGPGFPVTGSSRSPQKALPKTWRYRKQLHPWGDACLKTLGLLQQGATRGAGESYRKLLYDVRERSEATRYRLAGMLDLFDPGIPDKVFDEHLDVFRQAQRHTFLALTPYADSVRRHWERRKTPDKSAFPENFWVGVRIDCIEHLQRLKILHGTGLRTKWASILDYHSDVSHPLAKSSFRTDIMGLELVVFGWNFADRRSPLSGEDALSLANAAVHSDTTFFFTHPESEKTFLTGNPPMSELAAATNPQVRDPELTALFEEAQSRQRFPDGWLGYANWGKKPQFKGFEGSEVELFDYRPNLGDSPVVIEEAC